MADHDPEVGQEEDVNSECVGDVQAEDACAKGGADDICPDEAERDGAVVDEVNQGLGAESGEPDQAEPEEVEVGAVTDAGDGAHGAVECEGGEPVEGEVNLIIGGLFAIHNVRMLFFLQKRILLEVMLLELVNTRMLKGLVMIW